MVGKFLRREIGRAWLVVVLLLASGSASTWYYYDMAQRATTRADINLYAAVLIQKDLNTCEAKSRGLSL